MQGEDSDKFSLTVQTLQLTRALKYLRRLETRAERVHLKCDSGTLTISMGRTARDVPATGSLPQPVSVGRAWAEALTTRPFEAAITDLRIADGKLHARDFVVECSLDPPAEEGEESAKREDDLDAACRILMRYKVTKEDVGVLVEEADSETAQLWGSSDGPIIEDIALAWEDLVAYGVEPSDIRRLLHRKSRQLWKSGRRPAADLYRLLARYNVTVQDKMDLTESGDLVKARLWGPQDARLLGDIGRAWKHLAFYGVEPSEIRKLIDRKSPCRHLSPLDVDHGKVRGRI